MVTDSLTRAQDKKTPPFKYTTVSLTEIVEKNYRMEASVFGIEGRQARKDLERCKYPVTCLMNFIKTACYGSRSKRFYVEKDNKNAVGFLGSAEMLSIQPKPVKFLLPSHVTDTYSVQRGQILLSRSGTIGNVTYVGSTLEKYFISEHAIRISCTEYSGYIYTFLKSKIGRTLVESNSFGAVISQVEPEHLNNIPIPNPSEFFKQKIHKLIELSFKLRDESNELMDQAQFLLKEAFRFPDIEMLKVQGKQFDNKAELLNYSVSISEFTNRLDASYHVPIVKAIEEHLKKQAQEVTAIGDSQISQCVILPGRFKRIYVKEGSGVTFFGGKQLFELDPSNKKYLSLTHHGERIKNQLKLYENATMITCSGTIGKVTIVPKHWDGWTANQHIIRVVPAACFISTPK